MTRVIAVRWLETCLDRTVVKEVELSEAIDVTLMNALAGDATLQYFPDFPRPYFRVDRRGAYVVQGVLGNTTLRVTFLPPRGEGAEGELVRLIEG